MDNFKKIASLEELEALKDLIHYENSGEHKPTDKREKVLVDFTKPVGKIKPVNGVGGGPLTGNFLWDSTEYFKEARIPYCRLHDIEHPFGCGEFVDINCIFKNFNADENDAENYNFTATDKYIKAIIDCGAKVIFRLGTSIEHGLRIHTLVPKDFAKWARICEHIIRHYNEGWADGFTFGIEYWEIWNEPDLGNLCWGGTFEQFIELYKTAAIHLKACFGDTIKVGGAAFTTGVSDNIHMFLNALALDKRVPLDFYSFHRYAFKVEQILNEVHAARILLDKYGFTETETVFDEWNYVKSWKDGYTVMKKNITSMMAAAFIAGTLLALQKSPVNVATYYDAQVGTTMREHWNGLFTAPEIINEENAIKSEPLKGYYAFKAFAALAELGIEVTSDTAADHVYVAGAKDDDKGAFMLANFNPYEKADHELVFDLKGIYGKKCEIYLLDEEHDLELIYEGEIPETYNLKSETVVLVKLI